MFSARPPRSVFEKDEAFTLLEVIIALMLMAAVALAAGLALRLAVEANERIELEGDSRQVLTVLPSILEKQLALVRTELAAPQSGNRSGTRAVTQKDIGVGLGSSRTSDIKLLFCGAEQELSFLTAFSRQGSMYQGLTWVRYRYDPAMQTVQVHEQIITRTEDVDGSDSRIGRKRNMLSEPDLVGFIEHVSAFRLAYAEESDAEWIDASAWYPSWDCDTGLSPLEIGVPAQVALFLEVGTGKGRQGGLWIFPVHLAPTAP